MHLPDHEKWTKLQQSSDFKNDLKHHIKGCFSKLENCNKNELYVRSLEIIYQDILLMKHPYLNKTFLEPIQELIHEYHGEKYDKK